MFIIHIAVILVSLSFLVFIHEMGHFLLAKKNGVRVLEFGFGYPPKAKKLFTYQGTEFTINWIPFGGFVRMDGEEALEDLEAQKKLAKDKSLFFNKSIKERLEVILAGPIVNFVFGILAFFIIFMALGIPIDTARIGEISPGSPAEKAGLQANTEIIKLSFEKQSVVVSNIDDVIVSLGQHKGETVTITTTGQCFQLECQEMAQEFEVYVRTDEETPAGEGAIGIAFNSSIRYPWYQMIWKSIEYGVGQAVGMSWLVLTSLGDMVSSIFTKGEVPSDISGPVGIAVIATQIEIFKQGFFFILNITAMLSINLAIINILPLPALDGGRAVFILLEKVIEKEKLQRWEEKVNAGGYIFLLALIVLITIKDVLSIIR